MKKWEKFSKEELEQFVKNSYSYAEVCKKCGYAPNSGSSTQAIKEMIELFNFDITHFKKQSWNKYNFDYSRFKYGNNIKRGDAIKALVHLRGHQCERCNNSTWENQPIALEVHHLDGNNQNNELENLQLLCPNCHALTDNWRGKNINQGVERVSDEVFIQALKNSPNIRQALIKVGLSPKGGNYTRANELIVKNQIVHLLEQ